MPKPGDEVPKVFVLESHFLKELLDRAWVGEDPDMLILEAYSNSDVRKVDGNGNFDEGTSGH